MTGTLQPTATYTLTPTLTPTPTHTPTYTYTPTYTKTFTPTNTSTPGVFKFKVSPLPEGGQIKFQWGTTVPADEVYLKIYTSGFRLVREFHFTSTYGPENLTGGTHEMGWDGKDEEGRPMPPGNYLCFIDINVGKKRYEASGKTEIP
jgi:flagellar hook assembly protein FlgD